MAEARPQDHEQTMEERAIALAVMKNMEDYGFSASPALRDILLTYDGEGLKGYTVPQCQRSASEGKKTVTRGSALPLEENAEADIIFSNDHTPPAAVDEEISGEVEI